MIEIEQKFVFNETNEQRIREDAKFVGEETFTDIYYDTSDCRLIGNDMWLRSRDGKWELKISFYQTKNKDVDRYEEIETAEEIRKRLNVPETGSFEDDLKNAGYSSFCICKTTRRKYKNGDFNIVLDDAKFDDGFIFKIGEIELMSDDKTNLDKVAGRVSELRERWGFFPAPAGKIVEYLKVKRPIHYNAFVKRHSQSIM
ncbi:MAG: CYTH domain-containing protein [Candidatus Liptonbacteria bacterium]|nr:CYTH domain-containing protein [Candidatus Liptonbacteria bacterium]